MKKFKNVKYSSILSVAEGMSEFMDQFDFSTLKDLKDYTILHDEFITPNVLVSLSYCKEEGGLMLDLVHQNYRKDKISDVDLCWRYFNVYEGIDILGTVAKLMLVNGVNIISDYPQESSKSEPTNQ